MARCHAASLTDDKVLYTCFCFFLACLCMLVSTYKKSKCRYILAGCDASFRIYDPYFGYLCVPCSSFCTWNHTLSALFLVWSALYRIYTPRHFLMFSKKDRLIRSLFMINDKCHKDKWCITRIFNTMAITISCECNISRF